jgi:hypothetical protein
MGSASAQVISDPRGWAVSLARRLSSIAAVLAALLVSGCASTQVFTPAANATAFSPDGANRAAEYPIEIDQHPVGDARLWSHGAYRADVDGSTKTVVHIALLLHNTGATPLTLDDKRLFLEDVLTSEGTLYQVAPAHVDGTTSVPPAQSAEVDAVFALPSGLWPGDVIAYHVAWAVKANGVYTQRTPFVGPGYAHFHYFPYGYPDGPYGYYFYDGYPWAYWGPPYFSYRPYFGGRFGGRYYSAPRRFATPRFR